jgi:hypothetical protein
MGRRRIYANDAERQVACRARKAEKLEQLIAERDAAIRRAEKAEQAALGVKRKSGVTISGEG